VTLDIYVCNFSGDNSDRARALFDELTARFAPERREEHTIRRGQPGLPPQG
jgi:spermidine synthase/S-adenosylmethionine decarboxylase